MRFLANVSLPLLLTAVAGAQTLDVAIVAAASPVAGACTFVDPQTRLMATGFFNSVDIINATAGTPTLAMLTPYDAVITWSNSLYNDPVALGDVLADYADTGGGVVVCMFAIAAASNPLFLSGRWAPGYEVVAVQPGQTTGMATLGTVNITSHPIMTGVTAFNGGSNSYRPTTTALRPGGTVVAEWSDGRILVATGSMPNRADLCFYPPSSQCNSNYWSSSTDGGQLMGNALAYVAGGAPLGVKYCGPAVANSSGAPAVIGATGSLMVAQNDFNLVAISLPPNQFGIFVTSRTQGFNSGTGGTSNGNLCLAGVPGRFNRPGQILGSGTAGEFRFTPNLIQFPEGPVFVSVLPGSSWNFQAWFRDGTGLGSNFTDGVEVTFQ